MDEDDDNFDLTGGGVSELERRHDLERRRQAGARVEIDLAENTTFRQYVVHCRTAAMEALANLARVDANDPIAVLREQHVVVEYLRVRDWARGIIEDAMSADRDIQRDTSGEIDD